MPAPDYENDLVFPPKSADDLNEQRRQSDVLVAAIEKCEKLKQEVKRLKGLLKECKANFMYRKQLLEKLEELEKPTIGLLTRIDAVIGESEE